MSIEMAMKRRIDQVLTGVAEGDAITNMAFAIRDELRKYVDSDIYVEFILSKISCGLSSPLLSAISTMANLAMPWQRASKSPLSEFISVLKKL